MPFYILTSNPQIIRGNLTNWKTSRFGHTSRGRGNTRINNEIKESLSRNRISVSLLYTPKVFRNEVLAFWFFEVIPTERWKCSYFLLDSHKRSSDILLWDLLDCSVYLKNALNIFDTRSNHLSRKNQSL